MSVITLRKALGVLAKSSSFAVTTRVEQQAKTVFDDLKQQLFVKQDIEIDLLRYLDSAQPGEIIFLCGSSGDGKSEILTRCEAIPRYQQKFKFHLDATHSFAPHQSAIDTLNELFDKHHDMQSSPLLIGINTGMLANFAKERAEQHKDIALAIEAFLSGELGDHSPCKKGSFVFFDFEHYPKFQFDEEKQYSPFIKKLLNQLTIDQDENLFYSIFKNRALSNEEHKEVANFRLLSMPGVQDVIITQLFKIRLLKDQFVTARALLDLIHHLLLGPSYLFNNLFDGADNDLVKKMAELDPARYHTYELDQFILRYELGLVDPELDEFLISLESINLRFERKDVKPGDAASLIRLFWLLQNEEIGNNYHHKFSSLFNESLFERYSEIWYLHKNYTGEAGQKKQLSRFYSVDLIAAIQRYANRKAPELSMQKEEFFLGEYGSVKITAPVELKPDWDAIKNKLTAQSTGFDIYLKVEQNSLFPVRIGLNLFELLNKLNDGYRPNKYDKNAIVLLDEIVELITEQAKLSREIKFYDGGARVFRAKVDEDMISISGMEG